jgi:hypothetical protein
MNAISDTVMTLGAVACFADGPTTIRNVAHIRHKETDRIAALATELRKLGAAVEERADGLTITPRPLTGCAVDTYNDHRMAMSLALVGLRVPGVVVRNPGCVAKTYPGFWQDLGDAAGVAGTRRVPAAFTRSAATCGRRRRASAPRPAGLPTRPVHVRRRGVFPLRRRDDRVHDLPRPLDLVAANEQRRVPWIASSSSRSYDSGMPSLWYASR